MTNDSTPTCTHNWKDCPVHKASDPDKAPSFRDVLICSLTPDMIPDGKSTEEYVQEVIADMQEKIGHLLPPSFFTEEQSKEDFDMIVVNMGTDNDTFKEDVLNAFLQSVGAPMSAHMVYAPTCAYCMIHDHLEVYMNPADRLFIGKVWHPCETHGRHELDGPDEPYIAYICPRCRKVMFIEEGMVTKRPITEPAEAAKA